MNAIPARHLLVYVLSFLSLGLAGCGSSEDAGPGTVSFRRVPLSRVDGAAPSSAQSTKPRVVGKIAPIEGVESWEVEAPQWVFEGEGGRTRPLRLTGQGAKRVRIPGPMQFGGFDRV
ncbi:MAG: hypothetical protein AAGG01_14895, partial [Planctomycetota bacterium]